MPISSRRAAGAILAVVAACGGGGRAAVTPKPPDAPTLDLPTPWVDAARFRPTGRVAAAPALAAATANPAAPTIAITDATILTATGRRLEHGTIVLAGGAIRAIGGPEVVVPAGATVVSGAGKVVTPGLIDAHSHLGVYAAPAARANDDGNEATAPATAAARASYGYWPGDPQIERALAGAHDVVGAGSGHEALAIVDADRNFDVIVCDLGMPGLSGIEVYERLRATYPELATQIVFLTDGHFTPRADAFMKTHLAAVIAKPFEPAALLELITARIPPRPGTALDVTLE